jgi:REP element-mobilizing transposase RayT
VPFAETIAYCLMPNHFHFLIHTNEISVAEIKIGSLYLSQLSNSIRKLLSSYATAINKQQQTTGSLFRQKTKSELINNSSKSYAVTAFHYIHFNPLKANLVQHLNEWKFSSYLDYAGLRKGNLCNKELARKLIDINWNYFERDTMEAYNNKQ